MKNETEIRRAIGTLSHNRRFTANEISEYTRFDTCPLNGAAVIRGLLRLRLINRAGPGEYYPTAKGWNWLEEVSE